MSEHGQGLKPRFKAKNIRYGYHVDMTPNAEVRYVRCSKCGFICHPEREGLKETQWEETNSYTKILTLSF